MFIPKAWPIDRQALKAWVVVCIGKYGWWSRRTAVSDLSPFLMHKLKAGTVPNL